MTWEAMVFQNGLSDDVMAERNFELGVLGPRDEVRRSIAEAVPDGEWINESQFFLLSGGVGISIDLLAQKGSEELVGSLFVTVNGSGDPFPILTGLAKACGWFISDVQNGHWIDLDNPSRKTWQGYQEVLRKP